MSSSTSSSSSPRRRFFVGGRPALAVAVVVLVVNVCVALLPAGGYERAFQASLELARSAPDAQVVLFGDSRSTMLRAQFFDDRTLSFASANNTVIYSKLLFDRMLAETEVRPRVLFLMVGANNYNKNGIFTLRDFAIRRLASFSDLAGFLRFPDGLDFALDGLFARCFPVYGRRMEIRSLQQLREMLTRGWRPLGTSDVPGMVKVDEATLVEAPVRSGVADQNYLMIYERSVYVNYELSRVHTGMLEALIDRGLASGARVVVVQLPVEPAIRELEREMVDHVFDDYLKDLRARKNILHLDLRGESHFEFDDLNHLSLRGGREFVKVYLNPLLPAERARHDEARLESQIGSLPSRRLWSTGS